MSFRSLIVLISIFALQSLAVCNYVELKCFDRYGLVYIPGSLSSNKSKNAEVLYNRGSLKKCFEYSITEIANVDDYIVANYCVASISSPEEAKVLFGNVKSKYIVSNDHSSFFLYTIIRLFEKLVINFLVNKNRDYENVYYSVGHFLDDNNKEIIERSKADLPLRCLNATRLSGLAAMQRKAVLFNDSKIVNADLAAIQLLRAEVLMDADRNNRTVAQRAFGSVRPELMGSPEPWFALDILKQEWRYDPTDGKVMFLMGKAYALMDEKSETEKWLKMSIKGKGALKWMRDSATKYLKSKKIPDLYL